MIQNIIISLRKHSIDSSLAKVTHSRKTTTSAVL